MYRFPLIKTEAEKEQEMNLIASQQVVSAKQQSRVKQVTRDLVQWAEELVSNVHCTVIQCSHVYAHSL